MNSMKNSPLPSSDRIETIRRRSFRKISAMAIGQVQQGGRGLRADVGGAIMHTGCGQIGQPRILAAANNAQTVLTRLEHRAADVGPQGAEQLRGMSDDLGFAV